MAVAALVDALEQARDQRAGIGRRLVAIGDAQAAADVDVRERHAVGLDALDQVEEAIDRVDVRPGIDDLRADVAIDAGHFDSRQARGARERGRRVLVGDAELVGAQAGRDVGMGLGDRRRD